MARALVLVVSLAPGRARSVTVVLLATFSASVLGWLLAEVEVGMITQGEFAHPAQPAKVATVYRQRQGA